jgi:hypothetical protein
MATAITSMIRLSLIKKPPGGSHEMPPRRIGFRLAWFQSNVVDLVRRFVFALSESFGCGVAGGRDVPTFSKPSIPLVALQ